MKNKSSILYLRSFVPTYINWEINELLRRGLNVRLINLGNSQRSVMWGKITGLNTNGKNKLPGELVINSLAELDESYSYNSAAEKIAKFLGDVSIERIHSHFAKREAQIGLQLSKILGTEFSLTTHARDIFVPIDVNELQYLLRESPLLFTISKFNKKYLERYIPVKDAHRINVTYLGIDIHKLPKRESINKNFFSVYCVASGLVEKKGVSYLIKACEILKQKGFPFKCFIIGSDLDGKILARLRSEVIELGLEESIELPGILPSKEVLKGIAICDVFVLPCIQAKNGDMDGIPVSLIEAMGIGVPVVSTKVSGIPELITNKKNGFLVMQKNPSAIAEAVINICNNPEDSAKMENAARETVKEKFSIKKYVDSLIYHWGID